MSSGAVSLYIDDTSVRVMVTRGKRIVRLADMQLEQSLSSIDTPEKEAALAGKIRELLRFNKINEKKIIVGLSGLHCLTRPVSLPELPKAMIGEAVAREAKRILPMPLEKLYLTWQITSVTGGKTHVFLAAIPRQIADMVIRIINKAGCKPYLMDIKPLALARLAREAFAIILDVQSREFDIVVMVNGIPQPVRTIAFPQESLSLTDKFNIVKEDLKRTLDFVKTKGDDNQVKPDTPILVSGELAEHPELYESLSAEIGLKVNKLVSPLKYLKYLEPSQYLVNSGLALKVLVKEAGPQKPNFNTLPVPYQPHHLSVNKMMAVPAALGAVAVLLLLTISIRDAAADIAQATNQYKVVDNMLTNKQAQKKDLTSQAANLKTQIQNAANEYDLYSTAMKQLAASGGNMNNNLTTAVTKTHDGIALSSLSLSSSLIGITGYASGEEDVFKYVRDLTDTGRFESITITGITLNDETEGDTTVQYTLSCVLKADRK